MTKEKISYKYYYSDASSLTQQISKICNPDEILMEAFGKDFAEYRKQWYAADKCDFTPTDYPLELGFDILFACNLKCVGCFFGENAPKTLYANHQKAFPIEKFCNIVREGKEKGLKSVYFGFGSEPTMNKRWLDYVKAARDAGIEDVWFTTNGILLEKKDIDDLIALRVSRVVFSLDAVTEATYKKIRIGGDYRRVVKNIEYLIKKKKEQNLKIPLIRLSFVVNALNHRELKDFLNKWENKADYFSIQKFQPIDKKTKKLIVDKSNFKNKKGFVCSQPNQRLFILSNGDVFPCCAFGNLSSSELKVGNVFQESISEIWKSSKMQELRQNLKNGNYKRYKVCSDCAERASLEVNQ